MGVPDGFIAEGIPRGGRPYIGPPTGPLPGPPLPPIPPLPPTPASGRTGRGPRARSVMGRPKV